MIVVWAARARDFFDMHTALCTKPRALAVIRNRRLNSVALLDPLRSVQFSVLPVHPKSNQSPNLPAVQKHRAAIRRS